MGGPLGPRSASHFGAAPTGVPEIDPSRKSKAPSFTESRASGEDIRVVEDPDISPGGCHIQWGSGTVDATLETQLQRIEKALNLARTQGREPDEHNRMRSQDPRTDSSQGKGQG